MFIKLRTDEKKELESLSEDGYLFDWTVLSSHQAITVGYIRDGKISGLVEFERQQENLCNYIWLIETGKLFKGKGIAGKLLAYVGQDSLNMGYEGFVLLESKSAYFNYYQIKYGAKPIGGRKLIFDTEATQNLINKYLKGGHSDEL